MASNAGKIEAICKREGAAVCAVRINEKDDAVRLALLSGLLKKPGARGIYVSYSRQTGQLFSSGKKWESIAKSLFAIDALATPGKRWADAALQSPTSLTELSVQITKLTHDPKYSFVVLDSVSGMAAFNGMAMAGKFVLYLANKMRALDMHCVLLYLPDGKSGEIAAELASVSDMKVDLA